MVAVEPLAFACKWTGMVQSCGGGSGHEIVFCMGTLDICTYSDSAGYVRDCIDGAPTWLGDEGCKPYGTEKCEYSRTYINCCGIAVMTPEPKSTNVPVSRPDPLYPCRVGG